MISKLVAFLTPRQENFRGFSNIAAAIMAGVYSAQPESASVNWDRGFSIFYNERENSWKAIPSTGTVINPWYDSEKKVGGQQIGIVNVRPTSRLGWEATWSGVIIPNKGDYQKIDRAKLIAWIEANQFDPDWLPKPVMAALNLQLVAVKQTWR